MPGKLYPDSLAEAIKKSGVKIYRPSNGTEGMIIMEIWCERCGAGLDCEIICATMCLDVDEAGYPTKWCYDSDGQPHCTAFKAAETVNE